MRFSPNTKQLFLASAPQLAALTIGGSCLYPATLLQQLRSDSSSIQLDKDAASWIASIHGLAGTLSIVMPTVMQFKGRKFAFLLSCILTLIGWILIYLAEDATTIIVGESFHGVANNIFHVVGLLAISELVSPALRSLLMPLLNLNLIIGMGLTHTIGCFVHWKTVCLIISVPTVIALAIGCFWPESPFWLANKGKLEECKQVFTWLRGTDEAAQKELAALIKANKEIFRNNEFRNHIRKSFWKEVLLKVSRRDFYLPCLHVIVIMFTYYWSGPAVMYILARDIFQQAAKNESAIFVALMCVNVLSIVCASISCFTIKYFKTKTVVLASIFSASVFILSSSIVTFCQSVGLLSTDSFIYLICWVGHLLSFYCGWLTVAFSLSAEIIPVQHRDLGGAVYIAMSSILHTTTIKVAPYMFQYLELWGTFLVFFLSGVFGFVFIWKYVPETKGKTLQEIESFYMNGHFDQQAIGDEHVSLNLFLTEGDLKK